MTTENLPTLMKRSPKLYAKLNRSFQGSKLKNILQLIDKLFLEQLFVEDNFERDPEVSFNPRPARICEILLDIGVKDATTLELALLCATKETALATIDHPLTRQAISVQRNLIDTSMLNVAQPDLLVQLAFALDEIRHLHISKLNAPERADRLRLLRDITVISRSNRDPQVSRLTELTDAACLRFERYNKGSRADNT